jgi:small subunit ribosomal protein S8
MDPISDMLTQIRNGLAAQKPLISVPASNLKYEIAKLLVENKYLKSVNKVGRGAKKFLKIELKYDEHGIPAITEIKKISKLGQRIYSGAKEIKAYKSGQGHYIISTSSGVMIDSETRKKGLGGEVICRVF